jgi:hypothetical protein
MDYLLSFRPKGEIFVKSLLRVTVRADYPQDLRSLCFFVA